MDNKPVENVETTADDNVSVMSDKEMLPSDPIPKRDLQKSNTSTIFSAKRKLETAESTLNKITCSNVNPSNKDNHSRLCIPNNCFDPHTNRNHCQGQLNYRERLDQHAHNNYDMEPTNLPSRHNDANAQKREAAPCKSAVGTGSKISCLRQIVDGVVKVIMPILHRQMMDVLVKPLMLIYHL